MSAVVKVSVVGFIDRPTVTWPTGWPIPRVGEPVHIGGEVLYVRTVAWYPAGGDEDVRAGRTDAEPFVYVVLGPLR